MYDNTIRLLQYIVKSKIVFFFSATETIANKITNTLRTDR